MYWPNRNIFQFDMDQEDSWNTLTPGNVQQEGSAVFGPKDVSPVAVHSFPGSQDAGMYTRSELSSFWDSILISAASRKVLKKFSQKLNVFSNNNKNPAVFPSVLSEQISSWTTWSHLATSKIGSWIHLDQLHMFLNILLRLFFSNL